MGTLNCRKCGPDNSSEFIGLLRDRFQGICCLQEVPRWPPDFSTQGFFISRREGSPTAIAVPSSLLGNLRWQSSISEHISHRFCTAILLGKLGVVSVYLPDISKPIADYIACMEHVSFACADLVARGAVYLAVCGDLQIELPPNIAGLTGPGARGRVTTSQYDDRLGQVLVFCRRWSLSIPSTFGQFRGTWLDPRVMQRSWQLRLITSWSRRACLLRPRALSVSKYFARIIV